MAEASEAIDRRRREAARLVLAGHSYEAAAAALGVSKATVIRDLAWVRENVGLPSLRKRPRPTTDNPFGAARIAAGMSHRTLAEVAGTSPGTVRAAERGQPVHPDTRTRLANALGVPVSSVFPDAPAADDVRPPVVEPVEDDPVWVRRRAVADLLAADTPPGRIAKQLNTSRSTVYRDIDALRAASWDVPPRPMGRPPGTAQSTPTR